VLDELRVENLLLIDRAELRLAPGLNIVTGETGAGKSVLAHALDLLLGARARPGIVRPGAGEAYVEGVFGLTAALRESAARYLPQDAEELVLARRVGADGRTRAFIGGRAATLAELHDIASLALTFHGQHEHQRLASAGEQLALLDGYLGAEQATRLGACAAAYATSSDARRRVRELEALAAERDRELELLEHELAEIDELALEAGEHDQLLAARERLRSIGELRVAAAGAGQALDGADEDAGAADALAGAAAALALPGGADGELAGLAARAQALAIECRELASDVRAFGESLEAAVRIDRGPLAGGEATLDGVEERLAAVERLARKHGGSDALAAAREGIAGRVGELRGAASALAGAEEDAARADAALAERAAELRAARHKGARRLGGDVRERLAQLAMEQASFAVELSEAAPGPRGADSVEFMLAANPGVPAGPVRDIASGGELARVMLAVTSAAGASAGGTLVFDEVDAGIGGKTARAVGELLRDLARQRQVICVTHLAQIASLGERHFALVKDTGERTAVTTVSELTGGDVVGELVRMLGADEGDAAARRHARDLLRAA